MTKSRKTVFAFVLLASISVQAAGQATEPVTTEQAMERYRQTFRTIDDLDCPRGKGDEIVVCGKRGEDQRQRLPLPIEEEPGRVIPGERFSTQDMLALNDKEVCVSNKGCAKAAMPLIPIAVFIVETIVKAATD